MHHIGSHPSKSPTPVGGRRLSLGYRAASLKQYVPFRISRHDPRRPKFITRSSSDDDADGEKMDIDELARMLSAEAGRLRSQGNANPSQSGEGISGMDWMEALNQISDGGFDPIDFELLQELGQISIQQQYSDSSNFLKGSEKTSKTAIVAFLAQYYSGMPFEDPVVVFLKEYLPGSQMIAANEVRVLNHLSSIPPRDQKWKVASQYPSKNPPIVQLLGYFIAGPSGRATAVEANENTVWIVSKWDGAAPLTMYPSAQQTSGMGLGRLFGAEKTSVSNRKKMIRAIIKGMLEAVEFCHSNLVAHGTIGSGTFFLSTYNDQDWQRLIVKLDSFGFASLGGNAAQKYPYGLRDKDASFQEAVRMDKRQLAIVILECVLSSLEDGGPSDISSSSSIERLLIDVYSWDITTFKEYVEEENAWSLGVDFLDNALWDVLDMLISGQMDIKNILKHSYFED